MSPLPLTGDWTADRRVPFVPLAFASAAWRAQAPGGHATAPPSSVMITNGRSVVPWMIATTCRIADGRGGP
jgi:hypothetical protein